MYKYFLGFIFLFSACSEFTINGAMCDSIAKEPNAVMPQECRNYVESEADKAFKNETKLMDPADAVKFEGGE